MKSKKGEASRAHQSERRQFSSLQLNCVVLIVVAVLIAGATWLLLSPPDARNLYRQSRKLTSNDLQQPYQSDASADRTTGDNPQTAAAWWIRAGRLETQRRISEAADVYLEALKLELPQRDLLEMRFRLLDHFIFLGDVAAAQQQLQFFRSRGIGAMRLNVAEARIHRMLGNPEQALSILNRIWVSVRNSPRVVWLRGRVHLDLGNLGDAERDFQTALKSLPKDRILHFNLAEVYRRMGDDENSQIHHTLYLTLQQTDDAP